MHSHVVVAHSVVKVNVAMMRSRVCFVRLVAGKGARCEDEGKGENYCCDPCELHR